MNFATKAMIALTGGLVCSAMACGKDTPNEDHAASAPASAKTSANAPASATASASANPAPSAANPAPSAASAEAAPIEAMTPKGPVLVTRKHASGQRYSVHLERDDKGDKLVINGLATVTAATAGGAEFALLVDSITTNGRPAVSGPKIFEAKADFTRPKFSVDAEERGTHDAGLYLTPIEHTLGTLCEPPREAHRLGDSWKTKGGNDTEWKFTGYDKQGSREYASFESVAQFRGGAGGSWSTKQRVATDDGYSGTCTADVILKLDGLPENKQSWTLRVLPR